jgi:tetratricopeptide (TPR) repeat protein
VPERLPIERDAVIDLRMRQLDEGDREVLTLAAIVGDVFWDDAILALKRATRSVKEKEDPAQVWPDDSEILSLQMILDGLCDKGFISRLESQEFYGVAEYSFVYEGLKEKMAGLVDEDTRRLYHMAAARWLEMISGYRMGEYGEVIARHLEEAGDKQNAAHVYVEAAKVAHGRYLFERAYELYRHAMENLDESEASLVLESLHEMGNMAQARGKMDIALECFSRMLQVSWKCVSRPKAAASLSKIGRIHRQLGDYQAARAFLERSLSLFSQAGDVRGIASTRDDLGTINYLMGDYDKAMKLYNDALNQRLEMGDERGVALSYEHIGQIERANGNYEDAEQRFREALEIRRKIDDEEGLISALNAMGVVAFERGNREAAISIWKEALEHAVKTSNLRMMEFLNNNIGEVFLDMGQHGVAESHFKQSMDISMLLSDKRAETEVCKNLGLLYMKTGNVKSARDFLNRSTATARMIGSREQMGCALRALGQLEGFSVFDQGSGPAGVADSYFQEALDIFDSIGNESEFLRTMELFGKFLFDHGRVDEAISVMEKALKETRIKSEDVKKRLSEDIKKMKQFASS